MREVRGSRPGWEAAEVEERWRVFGKLLHRLFGRYVCRETQLCVGVDRAPGQPDYLLITMVDKHTGARYQAMFSPVTADAIAALISETVAGLDRSAGQSV